MTTGSNTTSNRFFVPLTPEQESHLPSRWIADAPLRHPRFLESLMHNPVVKRADYALREPHIIFFIWSEHGIFTIFKMEYSEFVEYHKISKGQKIPLDYSWQKEGF